MAATKEAWRQFTHTIFSEEAMAEEPGIVSNDIGTTYFGETINRGESSPDSLYIFDPSFELLAQGDRELFEVREVAEGQEGYSEMLSSPLPDSVKIYFLFAAEDWIMGALRDRVPFQFDGNPRDGVKYRVTKRGEIFASCSCGEPHNHKTRFLLALDANVIVLAIKQDGSRRIAWADQNGQLNGSWSLFNTAKLTREELLMAKDIFDGLMRVPAAG